MKYIPCSLPVTFCFVFVEAKEDLDLFSEEQLPRLDRRKPVISMLVVT